MLTITALFTKTVGTPATGLALAEIGLYLYRRTKVGGVVSAVWTAENPTEEIGGGLYSKSYALDDPALYEYFGSAQYTGVTVLDSEYALYYGSYLDAQETRDAMKLAPTTGAPAAGSVDKHLDDLASIGSGLGTYTDTITDGTNPLDGAHVRLSTDSVGADIVYEAYTNASGVFIMYPDPGTYYRWIDLAHYTGTQGVEVVVA